MVIYSKMSTVSNFMFNGMSRSGNDSCSLSQQSIQSAKSSDYMLASFSAGAPMSGVLAKATSQPSVNIKGCNTVGFNGHNVDEYSKLIKGDNESRPQGRISLNQRLFATVPYLGRGCCNTDMESQLQQGDMSQNKKSANPLMEKSFSSRKNYPLLPSLEATVQNPANLVEGVAAEGWIRGGASSRDLVREDTHKSGTEKWFEF